MASGHAPNALHQSHFAAVDLQIFMACAVNAGHREFQPGDGLPDIHRANRRP